MNTKRADKIIDTKEWAQDSQGLLINRVIKILIEDGATEGQVYDYLELS